MGVKFTADTSGFITGLRFYKSAANTGTHLAHLWTSSGQLIATATFTNETASGWQQVNFATPVAITAGTTYVASYFAPKGHYADNLNYFATPLNSGSLHVPVGGGVYMYGKTSAFPSQVYQNSNYWVDVVLSSTPPVDTQAPTVTSTTPAAGATNVAVNSSVTVFFSEAVNAATISNSTVRILDGSNLVTANVQYNSANNSATITPTSPLATSKTYTISVVGGFQGLKDVAGNPLAQNFTSTFTTAAAQQQDTTPPTVTSFSPANGATNVAIATPITVSFSEALERRHSEHDHRQAPERKHRDRRDRQLQRCQQHGHHHADGGARQLDDLHDFDHRRRQRRQGCGRQCTGTNRQLILHDGCGTAKTRRLRQFPASARRTERPTSPSQRPSWSRLAKQ